MRKIPIEEHRKPRIYSGVFSIKVKGFLFMSEGVTIIPLSLWEKTRKK